MSESEQEKKKKQWQPKRPPRCGPDGWREHPQMPPEAVVKFEKWQQEQKAKQASETKDSQEGQ